MLRHVVAGRHFMAAHHPAYLCDAGGAAIEGSLGGPAEKVEGHRTADWSGAPQSPHRPMVGLLGAACDCVV